MGNTCIINGVPSTQCQEAGSTASPWLQVHALPASVLSLQALALCLQTANIPAHLYESVHILQTLSNTLKQAQTCPVHVHPGEGDRQNQPVPLLVAPAAQSVSPRGQTAAEVTHCPPHLWPGGSGERDGGIEHQTFAHPSWTVPDLGARLGPMVLYCRESAFQG